MKPIIILLSLILVGLFMINKYENFCGPILANPELVHPLKKFPPISFDPFGRSTSDVYYGYLLRTNGSDDQYIRTYADQNLVDFPKNI
jgi:hypothetical protein